MEGEKMIKVKEWTWAELMKRKVEIRARSIDEVIRGFLKGE